LFQLYVLQIWRPRPTQGCRADDDDDDDDDDNDDNNNNNNRLQLNYCIKINLQHLNYIVYM